MGSIGLVERAALECPFEEEVITAQMSRGDKNLGPDRFTMTFLDAVLLGN